jgi:peptidoglycan/LPS O-acetylase OafA/YrhL
MLGVVVVVVLVVAVGIVARVSYEQVVDPSQRRRRAWRRATRPTHEPWALPIFR